ncbi:hypothetical protein [Mycolicibacterium rhodesiae]|uniref:Deazaflavin-dependent nitroreductase family protein n=1 Tax=Mycolicibacterium rhodesiae TaxID=36814 RepID=A0A1X0J022_MYCRH|nr:hypothetical protein [Mycolicibacterium rhodesiae]MCV7345375.1 hypothetical protein [Mycolicibacterium rhodesiae]ORB54987.1 hypothetical protein BST42_09430 [Mycolicibacterium rhodesiae]
MADQTAAITPAPPPDAIMRAVNPLMRYLLRTPLAGGLRKQFMVLSFKGRKTGREFVVPVSAHHIDGDLYALIGSVWKLNFRGGAPASVLYDGVERPMRGELIEDREQTVSLFHRCASAYGVKRAQRMMGLQFRDDRIPTVEEFREAIEVNKLAAIRFTLE